MMKNGLMITKCLVLLVLLCGGIARAQESEAADRDALATNAYRTGDLDTARVLWEEVLAECVDNEDPATRARLCYNLGNIALRENRALEGVAWFSASLRLRPRDEDTWSNLELARLNAGLEAADRGDLKATMDRLLGSWTNEESSIFALIGCLPLALAFAFEALRGGRRARWLVFGSLGIAVLCATPWIRQQWLVGGDPVMVIAKEAPRSRSEPRADAPRVQEFSSGQVLQRTDQSPGWTEVQDQDGLRGWLDSEEVFGLNR
ncbi:MAG: hypothetical protein ACI9F9_002205 [Candidatus Paceibacteria bacterium]|jgi:hypothetical protein